MKTKQCNCCHQTKTITNFCKYPQGKYGVVAVCKSCRNKKRTVLTEMHYNAKKRAKKKGLQFDITQDDIKAINNAQNGLCIYSGITSNWDYDFDNPQNHRSIPNRASLDRIDSSKGYTKDNIQLVIDLVNRMKHTLSYDEMVKYCQLIVDKAKNRLRP